MFKNEESKAASSVTGATGGASNGARKGGSKGRSNLEPDTLVPGHWTGELHDIKCVEEAALKLQPGHHLVTGVLHDWNAERINVEVPTGASFTVVADAMSDDALQLRAPALDKRGIPQVCDLYVKTFGVVPDIVLRWAPI